MVKRRPHTAVVTVTAKGQYVKGEFVEGSPETITITGRYDPVNSRAEVLKRNSLGDEMRVRGEFYTKSQPPADKTPTHVTIAQLNIDVDIISWEPYQSHSIISV